MGLEQINPNPIGTRTIDTSDGHVTTCTRVKEHTIGGQHKISGLM